MAAPRKSPSAAKPAAQANSTASADFAFGKDNYILMIVGIVFLLTGFILMTGGGSNDPNVFSQEIFSFRRITLAPVIVLIGFGIEFYAIIKKSKE
jgi:hypothetical protein